VTTPPTGIQIREIARSKSNRRKSAAFTSTNTVRTTREVTCASYANGNNRAKTNITAITQTVATTGVRVTEFTLEKAAGRTP